jgi:hypothetical protein
MNKSSRYFYNRAGEVIDSITGKVIERYDNWIDARGVCDSMNDAKDLTFPSPWISNRTIEA